MTPVSDEFCLFLFAGNHTQKNLSFRPLYNREQTLIHSFQNFFFRLSKHGVLLSVCLCCKNWILTYMHIFTPSHYKTWNTYIFSCRRWRQKSDSWTENYSGNVSDLGVFWTSAVQKVVSSPMSSEIDILYTQCFFLLDGF